MADILDEFLETPNGTTFAALRAWLIQQPEYHYASLDLNEVAEMAAAENFGAVLDRGDDAMPNWLLSPSMHQYLAEAARAQGDEDRALMEEYLVKACLAGLYQSGDGSLEQPYLITHPADEYDLAESLGLTITQQLALPGAAPALDLLRFEDGSELLFDTSASFAQPQPANS